MDHRSSQLAIPFETVSACQRWRDRRASYRSAGEGFDPSRYDVRVIPESVAKAFVIQHHYAGSSPACRLSVGMFERQPFQAEALVGVAVFSVPMTDAVITKHLNLPPRLGVELGRLVLLDHCPGNSETYMLGRAFRLLKAEKPEVRGIVSFCDPIERRAANGDLIKPGHRGTIYRAHNGTYGGRGTARTLRLSPDGRVVSDRAISKIRNSQRGEGYALRQLAEMGLPARAPHEDGRRYLDRVLPALRSLRHPGNHVFTWAW